MEPISGLPFAFFGYLGMKRKSLFPALAPRVQKSSGFTLIEILVVIGIIVFLITMTLSVVSGVIASGRDKATKATIKKIDGLLTQRMENFTMGRKAQDLNGQTRQKVIDQKVLFKRGFPQSLDSTEIPTLPSSYIPANDDPATQSSEAMYLFLTKLESFGQPAGDEDAFSSSEIQDTDNDGLMEFVDNWGRPLRFYRWPTRLIRPGNPATTAQAYNSGNGTYDIPAISSPSQAYFNKDGHDSRIFFGSVPVTELTKNPEDPMEWLRLAIRQPNSTFNVATFEQDFHTPETWSLPLVISLGADGISGLYEPTDKTNFGHLAQPNEAELAGMLDNISNRTLQP